MSKVPTDLLNAAKAVRDNAHTPYSNFKVGAALRADSGKIYKGANVENASYGLTRCAEQSAIQTMASEGERGFSEIVVYTEAATPASPCGACRQILFEFSPEADVYIVNHENKLLFYKVKELLPDGFSFD